MEKQISIIIPTYNMEKYIGKCLDSLLIPEFDQVEVLVVNDGSKDRSSEIAHEYAKRYPNSIRVIDKENGNYGSCINAALPLCTGRYIKILDADDTFDTDEFSKMVRTLKDIDDEVIITRHKIINTIGEIIYNEEIPNTTKLDVTFSIDNITSNVNVKYIQMHRIAYNRRIFDRIKYRQTENVSYTDTQWAIIPLVSCRSFRYIDLMVYRYTIGREGQTMSDEQIAKHIGDFFIVMRDILNYYIDFNGDDNAQSLFESLIINRYIYIYFKALSHLNSNVMTLLATHDRIIKEHAPKIYNYLSNVNYQKEINYKVFKDIRNQNYPNNFRVPLNVRLMLSLKVRLSRILGKK